MSIQHAVGVFCTAMKPRIQFEIIYRNGAVKTPAIG